MRGSTGTTGPSKETTPLEVTLLEVDTDVITEPHCTGCPPALRYIRDVELETKYLMGKSFHRGFVDPDLGLYEAAVS